MYEEDQRRKTEGDVIQSAKSHISIRKNTGVVSKMEKSSGLQEDSTRRVFEIENSDIPREFKPPPKYEGSILQNRQVKVGSTTSSELDKNTLYRMREFELVGQQLFGIQPSRSPSSLQKGVSDIKVPNVFISSQADGLQDERDAKSYTEMAKSQRVVDALKQPSSGLRINKKLSQKSSTKPTQNGEAPNKIVVKGM